MERISREKLLQRNCACFQLQKAFNHDLVGFTPVHSAASQQGTVNDLLPRALLAKQIILQPQIERFTKKGVIFQVFAFAGSGLETYCLVFLLSCSKQ